MIRFSLCTCALLLAMAAGFPPVHARSGRPAHTEPPAKAADGAKPAAAKPELIGTFGAWGAYRTQGPKGKICYALAKPKERLPARLVRDPSYVLVSTRPADRVQNEISVIMGFPMRDGTLERGADVNGAKFDLVARGENAWVKSTAEETKMLDIMRRGTRLIIKAQSARGNATVDTYALDGISQALEKVAKECR